MNFRDEETNGLEDLSREQVEIVNFFPRPTKFKKQPSISALEKMVFSGIAKATDGCKVEPDGTCQHGFQSWLIELGMI